jgi:hypothetical protein
MLLDREDIELLCMDRSLVGIELLRAHPEDAPWQLDKVGERAHEDDAS